MNISNTHESGPEEHPALDISSLIDVCFLLLIYFLATSTILPRESDLDMKLPGIGFAGPDEKLEPLLIHIGASGDIHTGQPTAMQAMDSDPSLRGLPLLDQHLAMYVGATRAANTMPFVRIHADPECSHQRLIDVLNALAAHRIHAVTFDDLVP